MSILTSPAYRPTTRPAVRVAAAPAIARLRRRLDDWVFWGLVVAVVVHSLTASGVTLADLAVVAAHPGALVAALIANSLVATVFVVLVLRSACWLAGR